MLTRQKRRRVQQGLVLYGLFLAVYFIAVYHPLARRASELDRPLLDVWRKLSSNALEVGAGSTADLPRIGEALQQMQASIATLDKANRTIAARIALDPATASKIQGPFQLIDFQNERQFTLETLQRAAEQQKIKLDPPVAGGFPQYSAEIRLPSLLWCQLAIAKELVGNAIKCQVSQVSALNVPPVRGHRMPGQADEFLDEVLVELDVTGSMQAISAFLLTVPLRAEDGRQPGLPEIDRGKPALLIDRILLRRVSPDKPDEVQLHLTVAGFVYRAESSRAGIPRSEL
jgi:hypothetical protein